MQMQLKNIAVSTPARPSAVRASVYKSVNVPARPVIVSNAVAAPASTQALTPVKSAAPGMLNKDEQANLNARYANVISHFPTALGIDDFIARVEVALSGFGFTGDNTIACTNLCRDEVTVPLKDKIEAVFGGSFNTNGLGGVLTCGVTGIGAGLSHSPICDGKEHYVFFAFPHIAINSAGEVGAITRPGRPNKSCACGAMAKCLGEFKAEGFDCNCKVPGVHDPLDPEYSILKQRLARRARYEKLDAGKMDLVEITRLAERTISTDMEFLAEKVVDTRKANYAVITGVQIHNWATELTPESGIPSLEFVATAKCYVVIDGVKTHLDLRRVPPLSPRQLQITAAASMNGDVNFSEAMISKTANGTLKEVPLDYLTQRLGVTKDPEDFEDGQPKQSPWAIGLATEGAFRDTNVPTMDSDHFTSFEVPRA